MTETHAGQPIERRVQWAGAATLGLVLAGHTVLETGRDALFLANVPAERLPWVYIASALVALGLMRISTGGGREGFHARRLVLFQLLAASSALAFWWAMSSPPAWIAAALAEAPVDALYYALYVWSGVISSVVVVTFWGAMGDYFTVTQGKRAFASIAMGGSIGAVGGAGLATALAPIVAAETLLVAATLLFAASAIGAMALRQPTAMEVEPADGALEADGRGLAEGLRQIFSNPYAGRVAALVVIASATLTVGDYLFKSVLAHEVAPAQLSIWLSRIYLGLNTLSIAVLAIGVNPLIRRAGVDRALILLPSLMVLSSIGIFFGAALSSVVLLKTADGSLRHSLNKTATEILYLPMDGALRASVKGVIDLLGNSGAKALASLAILALTSLALPEMAIAGLLLCLALGWTLSVLRLRGPYLDVFRRQLRRGSTEIRIDLPELDIDSVGPLLRALSSSDDRVVLGAMELLHERHRCSLIPPLILYHPSPDVVARAIDIFAAGGHEEVLDFRVRLLDHEYARVRSAIVRAVAVLAPDRAQLEGLRQSSCPGIRTSAISGLLAQDWIPADEARVELERAVAHHEPDTRMAVANGAKLAYSQAYRDALVKLARDADTSVAREAVRAMHRSGDAHFIEPLVQLLPDRRVRNLVRDALLDLGSVSLDVLSRTLEATETPVDVLRHIPRTISRFPSEAAVDTLLHGLDHVRNGMVRFKILRGLQSLFAEDPRRHGGNDRILAELRGTVERALSLLRKEARLMRGQLEQTTRGTTGGALLIDLVRDKRQLATGRIFLLLALLHPEENFRRIQAAIRSERIQRQASGIELLENLVTQDLRRAVLGLASPGSAPTQLQIASPAHTDDDLGYAAAVQSLAADPSEAVSAFAMYHASEIAIEAEATIDSERGFDGPMSRDRALGLIARLPESLAERDSLRAPVAAP